MSPAWDHSRSVLRVLHRLLRNALPSLSARDPAKTWLEWGALDI